MAEIVWTEPALQDLDQIADFISLDKPSAAKKLVARVFHSVENLAQFPEAGRVPPELTDSRYRELNVGPCRIFYRTTDARVFILFVMRAERELRDLLQQRDPAQ